MASSKLLENITMIHLIKNLLEPTVVTIDKNGKKFISDEDVICVNESQVEQKGEYIQHETHVEPYDHLSTFTKLLVARLFPEYNKKTELLWFFVLDVSKQGFVLAKIPSPDSKKDIYLYDTYTGLPSVISWYELTSHPEKMRLRKGTLCQNPSCLAKSEKIKRCSRCMMIAYCSKKCQQEHWEIHKKFCKKI